MMRRKLKNYTLKGYTLVEMIAVMGIATILISLTFFGYRTLRVRAVDAQTKSNVRSYSLLVTQYSALNKGKYPISKRDGVAACYESLLDINSETGKSILQKKLVPSLPENTKTNDDIYYYCSDGVSYDVISRLLARKNYIFRAHDLVLAEQLVAAPEINKFKISSVGHGETNPLNINRDDTVRIEWTANPNNVAICGLKDDSPNSVEHPVALDSFEEISINTDVTYTLTCKGFIGTLDAAINTLSQEIKINVYDPVSLNLEVDGYSADIYKDDLNRLSRNKGTFSNILWQPLNATNCRQTGNWLTPKLNMNGDDSSESVAINIIGNFQYGIECNNPANPSYVNKTFFMHVIDPPIPNVTLKIDGNENSNQEIIANQNINISWAANHVQVGNPCSLNWNSPLTKRQNTGTDTKMFAAGNYTLTVTCDVNLPFVVKATATINITAKVPVPPFVDLKVNNMDSLIGGNSVSDGDTVLLTWTSSGAKSCSSSGNWSGDRPLENNIGITTKPLSSFGNYTTYAYTITCTTSGTSVKDTVKVEVINPIRFMVNGLRKNFAVDTSASIDVEYTAVRKNTADRCTILGDLTQKLNSINFDGNRYVINFSGLSVGSHMFGIDCWSNGKSIRSSVTVNVAAVNTSPVVNMWVNDDNSVAYPLKLSNLDTAQTIRYSWTSYGLAANASCNITVDPSSGYTVNIANGAKNGYGVANLKNYWAATYKFKATCSGVPTVIKYVEVKSGYQSTTN